MIEWHEHTSNAIKGFPMGDSHIRRLPIYLPPGFEKNKGPYPVVMFLAGWSGRGENYLQRENVFTPSLDERFDSAIEKGELKPFIGVFPDGGSKFGCSQYVNSPMTGNYSDYICDEIVDFVDSKYPTHRSPDFRILAGHSSGGFGALVNGMMRPDRFSFICSSAGDSFYELSFFKNISYVIPEIEACGGIEGFIRKFLESPTPMKASREAVEAMITLSMAALYAPNPKAPVILGDLFFDLKTGAVIDDVWKKWLAWDPIRMIDRYVDNLKKLKWIQLEAGLKDEVGLQLGHRQIAEKLKRNGIAFELNEYPGGHSGHHWRFVDRLKRIFVKMKI